MLRSRSIRDRETERSSKRRHEEKAEKSQRWTPTDALPLSFPPLYRERAEGGEVGHRQASSPPSSPPPSLPKWQAAYITTHRVENALRLTNHVSQQTHFARIYATLPDCYLLHGTHSYYKCNITNEVIVLPVVAIIQFP